VTTKKKRKANEIKRLQAAARSRLSTREPEGEKQKDNRLWRGVTISVRAKTVNEEERTIESVLSTETPVVMWDHSRGEYIPEVLLAKGAKYPKQVPLLDTHWRYSVDSVKGSVREIKSENDALVGTLHFASAEEDVFQKAAEGHLTDVSVGYQYDRASSVYIPEGETKKVKGKDYAGPLNVRTRWFLSEVSLAPIGADPKAKLRDADSSANRTIDEDFSMKMTKEVRAWCVAQGMDATLSDEAAQKWLEGNSTKIRQFGATRGLDLTCSDEAARTWLESNHSAVEKKKTGGTDPPAPPEQVRTAVEPTATPDISAEIQKALDARQKRAASIVEQTRGLFELAGVSFDGEPELREKALAYDGNTDDIRKLLLDHQTQQNARVGVSFGNSLQVGPSSVEKRSATFETIILSRALSGAKKEAVERYMPKAELSAGWEDYRHYSLGQMADEFLRAEGIDPRTHTAEQRARWALGLDSLSRPNAFRAAVHATGSFPIILANVARKAMLARYEEVEPTWRQLFKQAQSFKDFRDRHVVELGAIGDLPPWIDNEEPEEVTMPETGDKWRVQSRAAQISFSWQMIVNDDMGVIAEVIPRFGDACARTVNRVAFAELIGNPTMPDGQPLISAVAGKRYQSNYTVGNTGPTVVSLGAMTDKMRQMRSINTREGNESDAILNLQPATLLVPSALELTAKQLVRSIADPAANHGNVYNPATEIGVVVEPTLDDDSKKAFYLFCDPSRMPVIEVGFLQGHETPVLRSRIDPGKESLILSVAQTSGAKAVNFRGVQKHKGEA